MRPLLKCLVCCVFPLGVTLVGFGAEGAGDEPPAEDVAGAVAAAVNRGDPIEKSVVKITATTQLPDLARPWTKRSPRTVTGSGAVIEGKRILTNAHVILYASDVQVQANQSGEKTAATVEFVAPGIDLAVLKLEDESFFDGRPPLPRAMSPVQTTDPLLVYGFPTGGNGLAVTKGIVSRIEFASYKYSVSGLRVQIDAAINPGNSGGPAMAGEKMIGLAYSHLGGAQGIGYIIPVEEIELFLRDINDGRYDGKPGLYDEFQTLENPALRAHLHLDKAIHGVVVRKPLSDDESYPLKVWDVVTQIGDTAIDDQGMVRAGDNLRVRFAYLAQHFAASGKLPMAIRREGRELHIEVPVSPQRPKLLPFLQGSYPPYFVYGPLVFTLATDDFVSLLTTSSGTPAATRGVSAGVVMTTVLTQQSSPLVTRRGDSPSFPGEELVVVPAPFFPHKLARGYSSPTLAVVESINGVRVKNLRHLVELLRDSTAAFTVIDFAGLGRETIVLPREDTVATTDAILTTAGVRNQGSAELLAIWQQGRAGSRP